VWCGCCCRGHDDEILDIAFDCTGQHLATASSDGESMHVCTCTCMPFLSPSDGILIGSCSGYGGLFSSSFGPHSVSGWSFKFEALLTSVQRVDLPYPHHEPLPVTLQGLLVYTTPPPTAAWPSYRDTREKYQRWRQTAWGAAPPIS